MRIWVLGLAGLLSGCAISAGMCDALGPGTTASLVLPQGASVEQAFACLDEAMAGEEGAYHLGNGHAIRDSRAGVLETADYGAPNVAGFRLRAEVSRSAPATLDLSLRGAGAYCADLGVDREMARLIDGAGRCLRR